MNDEAPANDDRQDLARAVNGEAYFLDTNIVMYAAGAPHPLREPCRRTLQRVVDLRLRLVTDAEVLQEILHRYAAIHRLDVAETVYRSAVDVCDVIMPVTESDTARALDLLRAHAELTPRDAVHVATMEAAGVRRVLSADRDFDAVPSVQRIDPILFGSDFGCAEDE